jgi:hypothetical protein
LINDLDFVVCPKKVWPQYRTLCDPFFHKPSKTPDRIFVGRPRIPQRCGQVGIVHLESQTVKIEHADGTIHYIPYLEAERLTAIPVDPENFKRLSVLTKAIGEVMLAYATT